MNLLTHALPDSVTIGTEQWPISTSFKTGIRFELIMQDERLSDSERVLQALKLYYPKIPPDLSPALDGLLWFYCCGKAAGDNTNTRRKAPRRAYSFEQDAGLIYAAFRECYGVDLASGDDLHWWAFRAMLTGLSAECEFCRVVGYRMMDTSGLPKKQKEHYDRLKTFYALESPRPAFVGETLAERDRRMMDYVAAQFAKNC